MKFTLKTGKWKQYKFEAAIVMTGIVLMIIGNIVGSSLEQENKTVPKDNGSSAAEPSPSKNNTYSSYAAFYEAQIESLLKNIEGVKDVKAAVYVKSEGTGVLAENSNTDNSKTSEKDAQGGTREEEKDVQDKNVVIIKDAEGNESVVYVSKSAPEIVGIAVCVKGGASASLQEKIKTTLRALYGIPASKISITG